MRHIHANTNHIPFTSPHCVTILYRISNFNTHDPSRHVKIGIRLCIMYNVSSILDTQLINPRTNLRLFRNTQTHTLCRRQQLYSQTNTHSLPPPTIVFTNKHTKGIRKNKKYIVSKSNYNPFFVDKYITFIQIKIYSPGYDKKSS